MMIGNVIKTFQFLNCISIRASNAVDKKSDTEPIQEALGVSLGQELDCPWAASLPTSSPGPVAQKFS
jgi:hypothetical protein